MYTFCWFIIIYYGTIPLNQFCCSTRNNPFVVYYYHNFLCNYSESFILWRHPERQLMISRIKQLLMLSLYFMTSGHCNNTSTDIFYLCYRTLDENLCIFDLYQVQSEVYNYILWSRWILFNTKSFYLLRLYHLLIYIMYFWYDY